MMPVCQPVTETTPVGRLSRRAQLTLAVCGCAGASIVLYAVDPSQHAVYPQCLLYQATGIYCAGCGATRAIHALLHGQVLTALHDNVLLIAALPVFAWWLIPYLQKAWRDNQWPEIQVEGRSLARFGIGVFLVMLVFMALRNLPGWSFELLRPL